MASDDQHENTSRSDLLTVTEVAHLLRTNPSTVRYWRYTSYGPPGIKVGRRVLYRRSDIEAFIADRAAPAVAGSRGDAPSARRGARGDA